MVAIVTLFAMIWQMIGQSTGVGLRIIVFIELVFCSKDLFVTTPNKKMIKSKPISSFISFIGWKSIAGERFLHAKKQVGL
jgi:hypothetical protein